MNFKNKKLWIAIAVLILIVIILLQFCDRSGATVKPKVSPVVEAVYALGTVKSDRAVNIRFGMNSVITKFFVAEGDAVSRGEPLLVTDSSVTFRAPISGVVTVKSFNENEIVPSGQVILTVTDMKSLYVRLSLDQESITTVRKGMKAEISFENLRDKKITGEVESIYQSGGEFVVKIKVPVMPDMVLPEMTCDTAIIIRENPNGILIPASAIINGSVKIKRKGKTENVTVKTRAVENGWVEIVEGGIQPDDIIYNNPAKAVKKNSNNDPGFR